MIDIVLYEPEIPPNTGNVIRFCANFGCHLHLIGPFGFELSDRRLRRAGLDYHEWANVQQYSSLAEFNSRCAPKRLIAMTTKGKNELHRFTFATGDALLFGPESRGLPADVLGSLADSAWLRIPMQPHSRSLNLSNAVAIAAFEALRQLGGLIDSGTA